MNKELTPLEALQEIKYQVGNIMLHSHDTIPQNMFVSLKESGLFEIIENTLKDYEKLKDNKLSRVNYSSFIVEHSKSLKALEIIKKKEVDVSCLIFDGLEIYNDNMHPSRVLTQEEYDLLKEVLL